MSSNKAFVIDVETTLHSNREFKASEHDPDNQIVWFGVLDMATPDNPLAIDTYENTVATEEARDNVDSIVTDLCKNAQLLIGHNIKYDLIYILNNSIKSYSEFKEAVCNGLRVWDTQLAEYLLTGQGTKYADLDSLSKAYGGTLKNSNIKKYWEAGISTENIVDSEIKPYLEQDLLNTRLVALNQMNRAKALGILPLIETQMDALLATTSCEKEGMCIDTERAKELLDKNQQKVTRLMDECNKYLADHIPSHVLEYKDFNFLSTQQLTKIIFGGDLKYTESNKVGVYKSGTKKGKDKFKTELKTHKIEGLITTSKRFTEQSKRNLLSVLKKTPKGAIKLDSNSLGIILKKVGANTTEGKFLENVLNIKEHNKLISTYLKPIGEELVWEHDSRIHHTLNQCSTNTGRFSSSSPNLQNIPRGDTSELKEIFISRYNDGVIVEADYGQLEVVCAAFLSGDKQLKKDILTGVDMHLENAATVFNKQKNKVTKEERRKAKIATFQLQYGAGVETIAEVFGSKKLAQALIDAYYIRYPQIKRYYENNIKELKISTLKTPITHHTDRGYPARTGVLTSITGRMYKFKEFDVPWGKPGDKTFSPTQVKNYPVQGFATADVVPMMLGKVYRNVIAHSANAHLINTVHDSMVFDVKKEYLDTFIIDLKRELAKVHSYLKEHFDIDFDLPLSIAIDVGPNWNTLKEYSK